MTYKFDRIITVILWVKDDDILYALSSEPFFAKNKTDRPLQWSHVKTRRGNDRRTVSYQFSDTKTVVGVSEHLLRSVYFQRHFQSLKR